MSDAFGAFICFVFIIIIFSLPASLALEFSPTRKAALLALKTCEKDLPRSTRCVLTAIPEGVRNDK